MNNPRSVSEESNGEAGTSDTRYSEEAEREFLEKVMEQYRRENVFEEVF